MRFIDLKTQYELAKSNIQAAINRVLEHGQYIMGPEVGELENELAQFVGVKHVVANSSGTDALLMSLMALDIKPGDEVITSPFSFFATAEVIMLLQARPVFVDIEPQSYNIDAGKIEQAITEKTRAIMPVSLYGQCADMTAINQIAKRHGIPVIEDGAQSFGATHAGDMSCGLSDIGCTSFFPSKPLGCYGDAGACFTDDDTLAMRLREVRIHGQAERYHHPSVGLNARIDTIQAAILLEKIKLFPKEVILRQQVAERYNELLEGVVKTPRVLASNTSVHAQYTIEVGNREQFQQTMREQSIPTAVHYPIAMHQQPALAALGLASGDFPESERAAKHVVSLPMHSYLSDAELKKVAKAVKASVTEKENCL